MNDLELLETYGPGASPLRDDVLTRARAELTGQIARESNVTPIADRRPSTGRRIKVALVAAAAAGMVAVLPSMIGLGGTRAVALGPSDPLTFPLTPASLPAGLAAPVFERDLGFVAARYDGAAADAMDITVADEENHWAIPDDARSLDIAGYEGVLFGGTDFGGTTDGHPTLSAVWQDDNGDWVGVTGHGDLADAEVVEELAESLRDRPQHVDLTLTAAPEGWSADRYLSDHHVSYSPDSGEGADDLTVVLLDGPSANFGSDYGAHEVTTEQVQGRTAQVGRAGEGWVLEGRTSAGQPFSVQAPEYFTRAQVLEVAEGVVYRG